MKCYTALRFAGRPELHMTLRYMGEYEADSLCVLLDYEVKKRRPTRFRVSLPTEAYFGANHDIRVLLAEGPLPVWLRWFAPAHWRPHITCDDPQLRLTATEIAVMSKKTVIRSWELNEPK